MAGVFSAGIPWSFDWTTLSTFAFPGDAPRFMTPAEELHFSQFSMMLIWGMNATCFNHTSGATYAPDCYSSVMYCDEKNKEAQPFVRNMETSLQEQGRRLKATRSSHFPVLGYIEGMSIQQTYANQMALVDSNKSALLSIESRGLVDCFTWGGCNWQGVEYRQYDLRQQAVVDYYSNVVIGGLINNPGLDGSFVDVIDFWLDVCGDWKCSVQETADLTAASLAGVDAALGVASAMGKVLSISSHTSLTVHSTYYEAQLELLLKHGNGIRFWEFFTNSTDDVRSLSYETQTRGLPTHVHVTKRTMNPDWVELACFLLAMGEHSYFSFSGQWMLDSFDVWPEFSKPLGKPLGPPVNTTFPIPLAPWEPLFNQNMAYGWPKSPSNSSNIPGELAFLGIYPSAEACFAAARSNTSFTVVTWAGNASKSEWAETCWGRLDVQNWSTCLLSEDVDAPCYAAKDPGATSAFRNGTTLVGEVWRRAFENVTVTWFTGNGSAFMEGWD